MKNRFKFYILSFLSILFLFFLFDLYIFSQDNFSQENPNRQVTSIEDINSLQAFKTGMINYNYALYQKAIFYFKKALSYKSKNLLARYMLGFSYYKSGFLQNALFEWETLKSFGFNDNLFLNMLESIYFQEGNFQSKILAKNFTIYQQMNGLTLSKNFFLWPMGMDINNKNQIFLTGHRSNNVLLVKNGKVDRPLTPFGVSLGYPFDITFDKKEDYLFVSDYKNDVIYKLSLNGKILAKIGSKFKDDQKLNGPAGLASDLFGNIYVVDQGNNRIVKINSDGEFVFSFGKIGKEPSEFYKPVDIVFIPEKNQLLVSNSYNNRVDIFDPWGNFIESIESPELIEPRGLFYAGNDYLYIVCKNEILAYDFNNQSINKISLGSSELFEPYFCLLDKNSNLIVTEPFKQRISFFIPQDELYLNLDVKLERLDIRNYPLIIAYISVKDQFGRTVYGLSDENFTFNENESTIKRLNSDYSYLINDYPVLNLVIDTKSSMYNYRDKVNEIIEKLLSIDNSISYSYYLTSSYEQVKPLKKDLLALKELLSSNNTYKENTLFDQVFYSAVSAFTQKFVKGGIVLFTDGEFNNNSFSIHSQNDIINYAKNNYIPVYIFYFGSGSGKTFLKELAMKTNGYFFEDNELFYPDLAAKFFKNYQSPLYIVYYKTPYPFIPDFYRQVFITVQYNGRVGKNWLGYYMPEE